MLRPHAFDILNILLVSLGITNADLRMNATRNVAFIYSTTIENPNPGAVAGETRAGCSVKGG